jgi:hypothetical protein
MKLGVGLPGYLGGAVEPATVIEWARRADAAGFHGVAVHDRPNHDAWDPLATLAAAAAVTERVRLAITVVLLPAYDEAVLARQAAVVDRVSGGRLDLGVGLGARADDYQALGRRFGGRGRRLSEQLRRQTARHPPCRRGRRPPVLPSRRAGLRGAQHRPGRAGGGERLLTHYYGTLRKPFPQMVHTGDAAAVGAALDAYQRTGLDVLYLFPVIPTLAQLDRWAEELLPQVATPAPP